MNSKTLLFSVFLLGTCASYTPTYAATRIAPDQAISIEEIDALEERADQAHVLENIKPPMPSELTVKLREWGTPVWIALSSFIKKIQNSWCWLLDHTIGEQCPKCHERHK